MVWSYLPLWHATPLTQFLLRLKIRTLCQIVNGTTLWHVAQQMLHQAQAAHEFIANNCTRIKSTQTLLQTVKSLITTEVHTMDNLESFLMNGWTKALFGYAIDALLRQLSHMVKNNAMDASHQIFVCSLSKLTKHWDNHRARAIYRAAKASAPWKVPPSTKQCGVAHYICRPNSSRDQQRMVCLLSYLWSCSWQSWKDWRIVQDRFPLLSHSCATLHVVTNRVSWRMLDKSLLTDRRKRLTDEHTKQLLTMYYSNSDVVGHSVQTLWWITRTKIHSYEYVLIQGVDVIIHENTY